MICNDCNVNPDYLLKLRQDFQKFRSKLENGTFVKRISKISAFIIFLCFNFFFLQSYIFVLFFVALRGTFEFEHFSRISGSVVRSETIVSLLHKNFFVGFSFSSVFCVFVSACMYRIRII